MKLYFYLLLLVIVYLPCSLFCQEVKEEWVAKYNGTSDSSDYGEFIALDNQGNIYVTGTCIEKESKYDIITIKYNINGQRLWTRKYNGTANDSDGPTGIVVSNRGDVYVTGYCKENGSEDDYVTLKYNSSGQELWVKKYNGEANGKDYPNKIVINSSGDIFVTGHSEGIGSSFDLVTIKYNAEGVEQWINRYNRKDGSNELFGMIVADNEEDVYAMVNSSIFDGVLYSNNLVLIKYNSSGIKEWEQICNNYFEKLINGNALLIDSENNIVIAGTAEIKDQHSSHEGNFAMKFNPNGEQLWMKTNLGSGNMKMATDNLGNIFITGCMFYERLNSLLPDSFGTIKLNSNGIFQWFQDHNDFDEDEANVITSDSKGNIYVGGISSNLNLYPDYVVVKYNTIGEELWVKKYNGEANNWDQLLDLKVDHDNNIYVTGTSMSFRTDLDFVTIKYSQSKNSDNSFEILSKAKKAFTTNNFLLVLELLKEFPLDDALYFDAIALMRQALAKLNSINNQTFVTVSGNVQCGCNKAISGYIVFEDLISKAIIGRCRIAQDGFYCMVLSSGRTYSYYIDAKDFYPSSRVVDFSIAKQNPNHIDNINIVSYEEMKEKQLSIRINNIFFDFNESKLKPESYPELNRLYNYLSENSDIKVEISGHTDNIGTDEYNINLSNARAKTVKDYLVEKGISSARIVSNGYGKSNPVATNTTDEGRQMNRRVEFKIIK